MHLSELQKFTLRQCYMARTHRLSRSVINQYYRKQAARPKHKDVEGIITRSIERLIERELLTGYGRRTAQKWFIQEIHLTPKGRRTARALLGKQQRLPFNR